MAVEGNIVLESGELGLIVRECEGGEVADDNYVAGNGRLYQLYHPSGFKLGLSANIPYCADECDVQWMFAEDAPWGSEDMPSDLKGFSP